MAALWERYGVLLTVLMLGGASGSALQLYGGGNATFSAEDLRQAMDQRIEKHRTLGVHPGAVESGDLTPISEDIAQIRENVKELQATVAKMRADLAVALDRAERP